MKILVTGASGYIGRHIVERLLADGHYVLAADRVPRRAIGYEDRITYLEHSIFSGDPDIYNTLGAPDVCIHLAWQNGFQHNVRLPIY